jgi:hypothetical protein
MTGNQHIAQTRTVSRKRRNSFDKYKRRQQQIKVVVYSCISVTLAVLLFIVIKVLLGDFF